MSGQSLRWLIDNARAELDNVRRDWMRGESVSDDTVERLIDALETADAEVARLRAWVAKEDE